MTFIQPNRDSSLSNKILVILILCLVFGTLWLIVLYNKYVNFSHGLSQMRSEFKEIQAQNAELKEKIFNLVDISNLEKFNGSNFIQDKNPQYLEIDSKWSYASRY